MSLLSDGGKFIMPVPVRQEVFPNGYGASVILLGGRRSKHYPYEVAVLYGGNIVYDTPIADGVVSSLDTAGVKKVCDAIRALPPRHPWPGENDNTPGNDVY